MLLSTGIFTRWNKGFRCADHSIRTRSIVLLKKVPVMKCSESDSKAKRSKLSPSTRATLNYYVWSLTQKMALSYSLSMRSKKSQSFRRREVRMSLQLQSKKILTCQTMTSTWDSSIWSRDLGLVLLSLSVRWRFINRPTACALDWHGKQTNEMLYSTRSFHCVALYAAFRNGVEVSFASSHFLELAS